MTEIFVGAPKYANDHDYGKWLLTAAVVLIIAIVVWVFLRMTGGAA